MAKLKPHVGAAIMAAAETYPYVFAVILEAIQNAMDADAQNVWVDINRKKREVRVYDDGVGVTKEKFDIALQTVGRSIKGEQVDAYGQFGRGLVAPLGKCDYFTFTSNGLEWTFVTEDIENSADEVDVPEKEVEIVFSKSQQKRQKHPVNPNWRTRMVMYGVTKDRKTSEFDVNKLAATAVTNFRTKMLRNETVLRFTVQPLKGPEYTFTTVAEPYSGTKLDPFVFEPRRDKLVEIKLFLALHIEGKYSGSVSTGTLATPYRVPFETLLKNQRSLTDLLDDEIVQALCSGIFEGELLSNTLTLSPERVSYEDNDGFVEFCMALENWYEHTGREYYQEALSREDSERFEKNAEKALDALNKLFEDPSMRMYADLVGRFPADLPGTGAQGPDPTGDDEETDVPASKTPSPKKTGEGGSPGGGNGTGGDNPTPGGGGGGKNGGNGRTTDGGETKVPDPSGKERKTVKAKSFGLRLGETQHLSGPWQLDLRVGVLWINTKHPLYLQCADYSRNPDLCIRRYQQHVAIQALSLHCSPEESQKHAAEVLDTELAAFVILLTQ